MFSLSSAKNTWWATLNLIFRWPSCSLQPDFKWIHQVVALKHNIAFKVDSVFDASSSSAAFHCRRYPRKSHVKSFVQAAQPSRWLHHSIWFCSFAVDLLVEEVMWGFWNWSERTFNTAVFMISLKKQIAEAFEIEGWQRRSVFFCLDRLAQIFMLSAGCIRWSADFSPWTFEKIDAHRGFERNASANIGRSAVSSGTDSRVLLGMSCNNFADPPALLLAPLGTMEASQLLEELPWSLV